MHINNNKLQILGGRNDGCQGINPGPAASRQGCIILDN